MLGFAAWTVAVPMGGIAVYRWSRILAGRATIAEWRADATPFLAARIGQSLVHITRPQTEPVAALRFGPYFTQVVCVVWMGVLVALRA